MAFKRWKKWIGTNESQQKNHEIYDIKSRFPTDACQL